MGAQKVSNGFHCLLTGVRVEADGGTTSNASIFPGENLSGLEIDDVAELLFFAAAIAGEDSVGQRENGWIQGIVEGVTRAFIDGELNVLPCVLQSIDIATSGLDRHVIVSGAMKEADGAIANIFIFEKRRIAASVKRNVGGKLNAGRAPEALKTFHAGVERGESTFGKTHDRDSRRINSGMAREQLQALISINDHRETGELRLVRNCLRDAASRKCVQDEGGNAHSVESLRPSRRRLRRHRLIHG